MSVLDVAVPPQWKRQWEDLQVQLRDPFKLRVTVLGFVAGLGMMGIYQPMSADLSVTRRDLKAAEDRLALVRQIDQLRSTRAKLYENLPENGDINFWSEHLLAGIRDSGVILKGFENSYHKTKVGKLQNVYFDLDLSGSFEQIHKLITWIETHKYMARIAKLRLKAEHDNLEGRLSVSVLVAGGNPRGKPSSQEQSATPHTEKTPTAAETTRHGS
jgi:hypothetical protein